MHEKIKQFKNNPHESIGRWISKERSVIVIFLSCIMICVISLLHDSDVKGVYEGRFWIMKLEWKHCADIVLAGDSRMGCSVSPAVMDQYLPGHKILNYAFDGNGFYQKYLNAITQVLNPESNKRVIILGLTPRSLISGERNDHFIDGHRKRKYHSPITLAYFNDLLQFLYPMKLKEMVHIFSPEKINPHYYREYFTDGWSARRIVPENPRNLIGPYKREYSKNQVSPEMISKLIDQVSTWVEMGIEVYAFRPPTTEEMLEVENNYSGFDEAAFVSLFKSAGGTWLKVEQTKYPSYDGSHLCPDGAIEFSHDLARLIKASSERQLAYVVKGNR